jgi:hypothetical protein
LRGIDYQGVTWWRHAGKKKQFESSLANLSIDGNSTADPRSKEGKPLMEDEEDEEEENE